MTERKGFKAGDEVSWETSQGRADGKVVRKLTRATRIKGYVAKPDAAHPEYLVDSDKTGERAAHRPEALKRR